MIIPMLHIYKETWAGTSAYIKGDWVKGSDNKLYLALDDGGEAEDPTLDTDNTFWQIADNGKYSFTNTKDDPISFNGINLLVDKINQLIGVTNNAR